MPLPTRRKIFDLVGESRAARDGTPRQELLAYVEPGDPVTLERQPSNPHDPNAIAVNWGGYDIGYLPRDDAEMLAPALDEGREYSARIHEVKGGVKGYASYGVCVAIAWDGKSLPPWRELHEDQQRSRRGKLAAMKRSRDATGAFTGSSNLRGWPQSGCLGVVGVAMLVSTLAATLI
jgi:hypothetical protein